ncbi:MAG TPA: SURF1 family protein [Nocardioidaceae bacterium]|nr:SURF1 family protein [Nocardioidaceae bacterium]
MGFLLTRRWLLFLAAIAVLAYGCVWLGEWQFNRLHDREARNAAAERNLAMDPVPVEQVMSASDEVTLAEEWSRVVMTGTYRPDDSVVVRYQTRDGVAGVDIVTPLVLADGTGVLVDRGWLHTDNIGSALAEAPAPPAGEVDVVGWVRADGTGDSTRVDDGSVRSISSRAIGAELDYPLLRGFVDAESESPQAAVRLEPAELPDLGEGPHFFYGLQWWFFGLLAVFGFGYLAYDERRRERDPKPALSTSE